jgi:hypothetical protein
MDGRVAGRALGAIQSLKIRLGCILGMGHETDGPSLRSTGDENIGSTHKLNLQGQ